MQITQPGELLMDGLATRDNIYSLEPYNDIFAIGII